MLYHVVEDDTNDQLQSVFVASIYVCISVVFYTDLSRQTGSAIASLCYSNHT